MDDLDKKLRETVVSIQGGAIGSNRDQSTSAWAEAIKQAFKDAGYGRKVSLRTKIRLLTSEGYKDYEDIWTPQVLVPRNVLHKSLDAYDKNFVEVELLNEGEPLMTGQEFYNKFEKYFSDRIDETVESGAKYTLDDITYLDDFSAKDILDVTKKAAGIE